MRTMPRSSRSSPWLIESPIDPLPLLRLSFAPSTRGRARRNCRIMPMEPLDLPPLWSPPAVMGHNGGPALERRAPGRPSISTPELRDRILDLLIEGVPLRVICRAAGMPSRRTLYRWRDDDPAFERACRWSQEEGYIFLACRVFDEVEAVMKVGDARLARQVFNFRRQQLARQAPAYFGDRGLGR